MSHLSGYRSVQKKRHYSADNPILIHDVQLCDVSVGVWCAMSATRIIESFFSPEAIHSHRYVTDILTTLSRICPNTRKSVSFSQQDGATAAQLTTVCLVYRVLLEKQGIVTSSFTRSEHVQF